MKSPATGAIGTLVLIVLHAVTVQAQESRKVAATSYLERGDSLLRKGEFERAIADFNQALESRG